jgi:SAM-dependent methyltransferase
MPTHYDPELYALVHRGNAGDHAFYRAVCAGVRSVLELGCGYGRLIPALTGGGGRYRGLDLDPKLLALAVRARRTLPAATRARVTLSQGDMRTFQLPTRFERIVLPHSALYCLRSDLDVLRCFRRVRAQLRDDGEFVLDAYNADAFHDTADEDSMRGKERDWITQVEANGVHFDVFERTRWQKARQQLIVRYEYESPTREHAGSIRHRYLLRAQLEQLLARAGLRPTLIAGNFSGARWTRRSEYLVLRARPV